MKFPIANVLTVARIIMIPLVVVLFYLPYPLGKAAAAWVFILAAITDSLDGYLARKLGQTSALGAFLDPVADKLMVATALILLVSHEPLMLRWIQFDPQVLITVTAAVIVGTGDHDLRAARMDGGSRRTAQGRGVVDRQAQDDLSDDRPVDDAVSQRCLVHSRVSNSGCTAWSARRR